MDLLWVVDNSGSMTPLQDNLNANFNSFMSQFVTRAMTFNWRLSGSDGYLVPVRLFKTTLHGRSSVMVHSVSHSGIFVITPSTLNPINVFVVNATLGSTSSGDERVFSSFEALNSPLNSGFVRSDSFLGLVILSDEDDFSNPTRAEYNYTGGDHNYAQTGSESVQSYVEYLEN